MDIDEIRKKIAIREKTWRWNFGDSSFYQALEIRGDQVEYYRWSHDSSESNGRGKMVLGECGIDVFLKNEDSFDIPENIRDAAKRWHLEVKK